MKGSKGDNVLINTLGVIHLVFRLIIIIVSVVLFFAGGYDDLELSIILSITTPMMALHVTAFIRFAAKYPYTISIKKMSRPEFNLKLLIPVFTYCIMLSVIVANPWNKDAISTIMLIAVLLTCEVIHAISAAINLASLFAIRDK